MAEIYRDAQHAARERIAALERAIADKQPQAGGPGAGLYPRSELEQITPVLQLLDPEVKLWVDGNRDYAAVCATGLQGDPAAQAAGPAARRHAGRRGRRRPLLDARGLGLKLG